MKCLQQVSAVSGLPVAPLAGAWIEIVIIISYYMRFVVAPLAGAWIEIPRLEYLTLSWRSLPSRERGLKFPLLQLPDPLLRRSPRGSVD